MATDYSVLHLDVSYLLGPGSVSMILMSLNLFSDPMVNEVLVLLNSLSLIYLPGPGLILD